MRVIRDLCRRKLAWLGLKHHCTVQYVISGHISCLCRMNQVSEPLLLLWRTQGSNTSLITENLDTGITHSIEKSLFRTPFNRQRCGRGGTSTSYIWEIFCKKSKSLVSLTYIREIIETFCYSMLHIYICVKLWPSLYLINIFFLSRIFARHKK